jgi:20S proteasome alpha/beta subunit
MIQYLTFLKSPIMTASNAAQEKGTKAVTIALGFRCSDGVVLSADTEMGIPGWVKFPGSKIRMFNKAAVRPIFTFAGTVSFCDMLIRKIIVRILKAEKEGREVIPDIEEEALAVHRQFAGEQYEAESAVLMSLWLASGEQRRRVLFQVQSGIANVEQAACLGTGQLVTQGMNTELFQREMTVEEVAFLSVCLLAEAKNYGSGCGKDSQILLLHDNGTWYPFPDNLHTPTMEDIEKGYWRLKSLLRPVILGYCNLGIKSDDFSKILHAFTSFVTTSRERWIKMESLRVEKYYEAQAQEWDEQQEQPDYTDQDEDAPAD